PGTACTSGLECSSLTCLGGTCAQRCEVDCDCDTGFACDGTQKICVTGPSTCARCGDMMINGDEECDDGEDNDDALPDRCRSTCTAPSCGDGVTDQGEECDDANDDPEDGCALCKLPAGKADATAAPAKVTFDNGAGEVTGAVACAAKPTATRGVAPSALFLVGLGLLLIRRRQRRHPAR
ncbi:MAG: DUF4215 domain-containing protein, partial [Myxococcales bacterium]|nr:DUF4215 domain-containing protein [Myxococcales bacterium]